MRLVEESFISNWLIIDYCMANVNVSVNMTPEMLDRVDEEAGKYDMSRARYIRRCIRQAEDTPFDPPENDLSAEDGQKGAA